MVSDLSLEKEGVKHETFFAFSTDADWIYKYFCFFQSYEHTLWFLVIYKWINNCIMFIFVFGIRTIKGVRYESN
jgi:hypothetical protein